MMMMMMICVINHSDHFNLSPSWAGKSSTGLCGWGTGGEWTLCSSETGYHYDL